MDLLGRKPNISNGSKPLKRSNNEEGDKEEKESLLQSALKGVGVNRQRSSRRRVQWNDRNGENLVQVLEFERRFNPDPLHERLIDDFRP